MKPKPFYKTYIHPDVKGEWKHKEYGSFEDHKCPDNGHVYTILGHWKQPYIKCMTREEAQILFTSANYQQDWGSENELVQRLEKKAGKVARELMVLLHSHK